MIYSRTAFGNTMKLKVDLGRLPSQQILLNLPHGVSYVAWLLWSTLINLESPEKLRVYPQAGSEHRLLVAWTILNTFSDWNYLVCFRWCHCDSLSQAVSSTPNIGYWHLQI